MPNSTLIQQRMAKAYGVLLGFNLISLLTVALAAGLRYDIERFLGSFCDINPNDYKDYYYDNTRYCVRD